VLALAAQLGLRLPPVDLFALIEGVASQFVTNPGAKQYFENISLVHSFRGVATKVPFTPQVVSTATHMPGDGLLQAEVLPQDLT